MRNATLKNRIIDISRRHDLSHLGSTLTAVDIIKEIYDLKRDDEKFVLSCGHAGLALYVVLEEYGFDAEELLEKCGIHPERMDGIDCSTGSLGQGLPIALGMAMANPTKNVYCLISDGEAAEGTIWEVANVVSKYKVGNLQVYMNYNGWGAYDPVPFSVIDRVKAILPNIHIIATGFKGFPFLQGQHAHYCKTPN